GGGGAAPRPRAAPGGWTPRGAPPTTAGWRVGAPRPPAPRKTSPPIHILALGAVCAQALAHTSSSARAAPPAPPPDAPKIVDKPIPFDDERVRLTLEYRRQHEDPEATDLTIEPKVIVLH